MSAAEFAGKTVLVTGVAGQDGFYLAQKLSQTGARIVGTVRTSATRATERLLPNTIERVVLDYSQSNNFSIFVRDVAPDFVFNFAALSSLALSEVDRDKTMRVNYSAPKELFDAVFRQNENARIIQASSALVFASGTGAPLTEASEKRPDTFYAEAKHSLDEYLMERRRGGAFTCSAFLFNHESPIRGADFVSRKIIDGLVRTKTGEEGVLSLRSFDDCRDWSHAADFVDAMILMAKADRPDDFVLGSGVLRTVWDWIDHAGRELGFQPERVKTADGEQAICAQTGQVLALSQGDHQAGHDRYGSPEKLKSAFGWRPRYSFEDMVAEMVADSARRQGL